MFLPSVDASSSGWSIDNVVSFLPAFENDLAVVLHLANVGTVVVKSHVTNQQDLKEENMTHHFKARSRRVVAAYTIHVRCFGLMPLGENSKRKMDFA